MITGGLVGLSGCAKVLVKGADDIASKGDEAARGADEAAKGASRGASGLDDIGTSTATPTATAEPVETVGDISDYFPLTSIDTDIEVEAGSYTYWELSFSEEVEPGTQSIDFSYTVIVREGAAVDVILIPREELQYFEQSQSFEYYTEASELSTEYATESGSLDVDDYVFIVDNSSMGTAAGDYPATVSVQIEANEIE